MYPRCERYVCLVQNFHFFPLIGSPRRGHGLVVRPTMASWHESWSNWFCLCQKKKIDFALDCETTTKAFHHRADIIEFGQVMAASRRLFTSSFTNSQVEFNRRQANEIAHTLAQVVPFSASPTIYIYVPPCIKQSIANEML
jgi:hypothetical protein